MSRSEHEGGGRSFSAHAATDALHDIASVPAIAQYQATFREARYYSTGREWSDYAPAYRLGMSACAREPGARFDACEATLETAWAHVHGASRLSWAEARGACEHAWRDCRSGEGAHAHETAATTPGRHGG